MLLEGQGIVAGYGDSAPIVQGVDFTLAAGSMTAVIGPNGAGKSTLLKALAGLLGLRAGTILLEGDRIDSLPAREIARRGLVFVPQERSIFGTMTVRENLEIAGYLEGRAAGPRMQEMLTRFPDLARKRSHQARTLSGGQRRTLAMAMALMRSPKVMMLDEPTAGLSPVAAEGVFEIVRQVRASGLGVLIVEQNAVAALEIADQAWVLVDGRTALTGQARDLAQRDDVRALFLGQSSNATADAAHS